MKEGLRDDLKLKLEIAKRNSDSIQEVLKKGKAKVLALDVATHCGWAISKEVSGVWDLSPKRDESAGMRLIRFKAKLKTVIEAENVNIVVFEKSAGLHKSSIIVQSEFHGVLKLFLEEMNLPYRSFSATEIKKFATDKGNANKTMMVEACRKNYSVEPVDDNHADALHILFFAKDHLNL